MNQAKRRRPRDPVATRAAILDAACTLLARTGPEGVSLSEVALLAGVNRGTAYQHFADREQLISAATDYVSQQMFRAVFGDPATLGERKIEEIDIVDVAERLAYFAMENPDLCRSWFLQVLSLPDPAQDPFWREYAGSIHRFAQTEYAEPGIDVAVWSVICLAGSFLWPVWARAHSHDKQERKALAQRFSREMLRVSMFGSLNIDKYPHIAAQLTADRDD